MRTLITIAATIVALYVLGLAALVLLATMPWPMDCPRDLTDPIAVRCAR